MELRSAVNGYTAWSNMRLVRSDCESNDILKGLAHGRTMKALCQELTGSIPRGLDSMENLTAAQKSTRVNWFIDTLKKYNKLPVLTKVDSTMFSLSVPTEVLPVLRLLVNADITEIWKVAPVFQKKTSPHVVIAEPLKFGPCKITKEGKHEVFYTNKKRVSVAEPYRRSHKESFQIDAPYLLIGLINGQLKLPVEGAKLRVKGLQDLLDSRVLCTLVNSLIPDTFTSEVLLNDRWTINLALDAASEVFRVTNLVNSRDLYQNSEEGMCAYWIYFIASGLQFIQARAVVQKVKAVNQLRDDLKAELNQAKAAGQQSVKRIGLLEKRLASKDEELEWIQSVYDHEKCSAWVQHALAIQAKVREKIAQKMTERFDVFTVPYPTTIKELSEELFIDLTLTGGNGLYLSTVKEKLWTERKVVVFDKQTGEYFEDFSGRKNTKGSVRAVLGVHSSDVVQVNPDLYRDYEIYFESPSRNKILKGGTKFLYQVFPGTTSQCERLLLRVSLSGDLTTIRKLVIFFKGDRDFVNCRDHETGNTALHVACRQGNTDVALYLLESGAGVNLQNNAGGTPLFLSTEGLHKHLSQLLLEWGADIHIKNRVSKKALDLIRNEDLKHFLEEKFEEYQKISQRLAKGDVDFLESLLKEHSKKKMLASLRSRYASGDTLFHTSAFLSSSFGVQFFLSNHIDPNLLSASNATPLHGTANPGIMQKLIDNGADVNMMDRDGNTPLHLICSDEPHSSDITITINVLVSNSAHLDVRNKKGWLPIHCAASGGLVTAVETMLAWDKDGTLEFLKDHELQTACPSLVYLSLLGQQLQCARWLSSHGYGIKKEDADDLLLKILMDPPQVITDVVDMMRFLLDEGAEPNAQYSNNNRPLHLVAPLVHLPELCELLLQAGALVDPNNSQLSTPLMNACKENNLFMARILIEKGADCHAMDIRGKCPFDYVADHEEWIGSGHFPDDIRALLKAFSIRRARELVRSISKTVHTNNLRT